jgi:nucleoside-triphosphatase
VWATKQRVEVQMGRTLLLTGRPGVGKTTVIRKVAEALGDQAGGFYTEEIRGADGRRRGFRLVALHGDEAVMAHVVLRDASRPRVSRYGVDVDAITHVGVAALRRAMAANQVVIVDEIGKMELFCEPFKEAVIAAVDGRNPVVATAMRSSHPWVDALKVKEQVDVWRVTTHNRDRMPESVLRHLER